MMTKILEYSESGRANVPVKIQRRERGGDVTYTVRVGEEEMWFDAKPFEKWVEGLKRLLEV